MKKFLSILSLVLIFGVVSPTFAAGGDHPPDRGGVKHGAVHRVHAGAHHGGHHRIAPRHGVGYYGHHPKHFHTYRTGYWGNSWCNYRIGCCDPFYHPYRPHAGVYFPVGGAGVSIRF